MSTLQDIWTSLENDLRRDSSSSLLKRGLEADADSIFLLAEMDRYRKSIARGIAFGCLDNPEKTRLALSALQQLKLYVRELGDRQSYLVIFLENVLFQEVFAALSEDLLHHISARDTNLDIGTSALQRISTWKYFFENCSPEGLSLQAQRGLLGELIMMKDYLLPYMEALEVVQAWQGPDRKAKDFICNSGGIEVKTTLSKRHKKIHIASEVQLDPEGYSFLYLMHIAFDDAGKSDMNLVTVVTTVRDVLKIDLSATNLFEKKLRDYGYLDIHSESYLTPYSIKERDFFEIDDKFPKITSSSLPSGVGDVSYSVVISDCERFRKGASEVLEKIGLKRNE